MRAVAFSKPLSVFFAFAARLAERRQKPAGH
jgi:hypothetical protein